MPRLCALHSTAGETKSPAPGRRARTIVVGQGGEHLCGGCPQAVDITILDHWGPAPAKSAPPYTIPPSLPPQAVDDALEQAALEKGRESTGRRCAPHKMYLASCVRSLCADCSSLEAVERNFEPVHVRSRGNARALGLGDVVRSLAMGPLRALS